MTGELEQTNGGAGGGTRTHTAFYGPRILSPVRLPFRHTGAPDFPKPALVSQPMREMQALQHKPKEGEPGFAGATIQMTLRLDLKGLS